jgi:hypothetical protein
MLLEGGRIILSLLKDRLHDRVLHDAQDLDDKRLAHDFI